MPLKLPGWLPRLLALPCAILFFVPALAHGATEAERERTVTPSRSSRSAQPIAGDTWVDHDRLPIRRPPDWEPNFWGRQVRNGFIDPLIHVFDIPDKLLWAARALGADTRRQSVNANAFDEVPNSTWFTNRNHVRAVPVARLRHGPDSLTMPTKPWTIKKAKRGGFTAGFQIKDGDGKRWLVKLDPHAHPQLSSGADMVARTLLHAAGYNVPHNEPVRFRRGDLTIDEDLLRGAKGEPFTEADLDSVIAKGAVFPDGSYSAVASLFLQGDVLGSPSMSRLRPADTNDWYTHTNRRELRGLFILCSWINSWDTKDHQFLDLFVETRDSLGHVEHYILDSGASFGAGAARPKQLWDGYENAVDFAWIGQRFVTLGFLQEPWRRARQASGIPSIGNFESEVYAPQDFRPRVQQPAFREMTDRDGYWGAKIVASFSDAQIAAAVDAAHYDDPRARDYLVRNLIVRRDKIARHWFELVAPLDFFRVEGGALRFHDLALDIGLAGAREYEIEVEPEDGPATKEVRVRLNRTELPLLHLGNGASRLSLEISVAGSRARPARVELTREGDEWVVTRVRHG
ncbi:MAG: hypothetical protein ABIS67_15325 [Candidatus Eisenbacteria bacterium]